MGFLIPVQLFPSLITKIVSFTLPHCLFWSVSLAVLLYYSPSLAAQYLNTLPIPLFLLQGQFCLSLNLESDGGWQI